MSDGPANSHWENASIIDDTVSDNSEEGIEGDLEVETMYEVAFFMVSCLALSSTTKQYLLNVPWEAQQTHSGKREGADPQLCGWSSQSHHRIFVYMSTRFSVVIIIILVVVILVVFIIIVIIIVVVVVAILLLLSFFSF